MSIGERVWPGRDIIYHDYHDWAVDELHSYIDQLRAALKECDEIEKYRDLLARADKPFLKPEDDVR